MRTVAGGLLAALIPACSALHAASAPPAHSGPAPADQSGNAATAVPPPAPQPTAEGPCRYLPTAAVQIANGQRVTAVRISADQPYPACFFLASNGTVQLRTWIVVATPGVARATVDAAAPVATSDRAELPGGWSGGSQPTTEGAVFAVSRQGTAVVITTNQHQTIGARRVAEQVIAALDR